MAIKWQDIVKYGGTGLVSLFVVLAGILTLAGVSHSDDGDKECTDCYSEIKIFSTYWEVRVTFERPDENVVFKKRTRSRTLWINLHKIEELVTTNPQIKVDILVPTNRIAFTEINHPEYGRLRFLKEGDALIKRNTKSKPGPSRIILHGQKDALQTVKWNFDLEHWLMENVNIDPVWLSTGFRPIIKCDESVRTEYDVCIRTVQVFYDNYTFINNVTKLNETRVNSQLLNSTYNCNPHQVSFKENCRIVGFNTTDLTASCPDRYRCDIIGLQFCYVSLDDGDVNFNFRQADGRGWDGACVSMPDLREGPIKVSSYRNVFMDVKRR